MHEKSVNIEIKLHFLDKIVWDYALYILTCNTHEDWAETQYVEHKALYKNSLSYFLTFDFEIGTQFQQIAHLKYHLSDGSRFKYFQAYADTERCLADVQVAANE
ncbi:MAG: hypothetical protein EZS28_020843 [Streblomastix strix]|uniref:Uncharacterized protein n=1 Tax=Streblomastix strix TaxID=222440 RepID=A0A5J4VM08_9EUKA|nr:MAG: hypothetical protein EZS28_020843 [Streblomastix strix]